MLPAAKALLVTVLLGGGTVGTYALAGGKFGSGSSGNGNAETTQTVTPEAAKPAASVPIEATPPTAVVARDGGQSLQSVPQVSSQAQVAGGGLSEDRRDAEEGQTDLQTSDPVSSQNNTLENASGDQGITKVEKSGPAADGDTIVNNVKNAPGSSVPEGKPGSGPTGTQASKESGSEANGLNGENTRITDPKGTPDPSSSGDSLPAPSSNPGGTERDGAKGAGQETRTASGGEETRTPTGEQGA